MSKIFRMLKEHPDVVPVFVITCVGATFAAAAIFRAGRYYTDVSFDRKNNPHPWLNVKPDQQTKFIHAYDYSKLKKEHPEYEEK